VAGSFRQPRRSYRCAVPDDGSATTEPIWAGESPGSVRPSHERCVPIVDSNQILMRFVVERFHEHDIGSRQFATNGANHPLDIGSRQGGAVGRQDYRSQMPRSSPCSRKSAPKIESGCGLLRRSRGSWAKGNSSSSCLVRVQVLRSGGRSH